MQQTILAPDVIAGAAKAFKDGLEASKPMINRHGEVIDEWPDHTNRIKAADKIFLMMEKLLAMEAVTKEELDEAHNDYWKERYVYEMGKEPSVKELEGYRNTIDVESAEVQESLFSSERRMVDLRPSTFTKE